MDSLAPERVEPLLAGRLGREPRPYAGPRLKVLGQVTEYLARVDGGGEPWLACSRCGQPLGPVRENYKLHCHRVDHSIQTANTLIGDPQRFVDATVQFRQFYCPGCGGLLENEVARTHDEVLYDIQIHA